jgi:predicted AAA+ superfamily ATPase
MGGSIVAPYVTRVVDDELDALIEDGITAVALEGPKAAGKTATALERARTVFALDRPDVRDLARADPARLIAADPPVLLDEWQQLPELWDLVKRAADDNPAPGRFVLTGSAARNEPGTHSGAGRIIRLRMRPMSTFERGAEPTVSLAAMLSGDPTRIDGTSDVRLEGYVDEILASGFPAIRQLGERARSAQLDGYIERVVDCDFAEVDRQVRRPAVLMRWLRAYAAATSTTTSFDKIRDAATGGEADKPARTTTAPYRDALERLWLIEEVPGWAPTHNHLRRLTSAPKHHLADPALAARLVGIDAGGLLAGQNPDPVLPRDGTFLGALFESLVTLDVRTYAQAAGASVHHLRTRAGEHEADLIVVRPDQRVVALEVKLSAGIDDRDVKHLLWLRKQIGDQLLDAAVITTGEYAYRRPDGVAVIPLALLGP